MGSLVTGEVLNLRQDIMPRVQFVSPDTLLYGGRKRWVYVKQDEIPKSEFLVGLRSAKSLEKVPLKEIEDMRFLQHHDASMMARNLMTEMKRESPVLGRLAKDKSIPTWCKKKIEDYQWRHILLPPLLEALEEIGHERVRVRQRLVVESGDGIEARRVAIGVDPFDEKPGVEQENDRAILEVLLLRPRVIQAWEVDTSWRLGPPDDYNYVFYQADWLLSGGGKLSGSGLTNFDQTLGCQGFYSGQRFLQYFATIFDRKMGLPAGGQGDRINPGWTNFVSRHEAAHAIDPNTYDVLPRVRGEGWAQAITSRLNPLALRARFHRGFPGAVVTAEDLTKLFSKDPGGRRISEIYDESGAFFSYLAQRFGFEALVWMTGILDVGMATIRSERNYSAIANLPVALEELGKKVPDLRPEEFLTDFEGFMNAATS